MAQSAKPIMRPKRRRPPTNRQPTVLPEVGEEPFSLKRRGSALGFGGDCGAPGLLSGGFEDGFEFDVKGLSFGAVS